MQLKKEEYIIEVQADGDSAKFNMYLNEIEFGTIKQLVDKCETYLAYVCAPVLIITKCPESENKPESGKK